MSGAIGFGPDAPTPVIGRHSPRVLDETMDQRLAELQRRCAELEQALETMPEPKQETES